jgi:hypothetical protein
VRALEANGVIDRYVALARPAALGLGLNVFISISLRAQNKEALALFEQRIAEHDEVMECYLMTGESDYLIRVAVTDIGGYFSLFLDAGDVDLEFIHPSGLQARSSLDNLRITANSRDLGDIVLPPVTLGSLDLTSPASAPVSDAKLRIFELPDIEPRLSLSCDGQSPCSRTGKLRAEAFTNKSGRAQFLLPGAKVRLAAP